MVNICITYLENEGRKLQKSGLATPMPEYEYINLYTCRQNSLRFNESSWFIDAALKVYESI